jgi:hypothetical protein
VTGLTLHTALLREAAALLAAGGDHRWDELLPIVRHFEGHNVQCWQDLAMATLEAMVAGNVCELLGRDPWSAAAPLMTRLLRRLARHAPADSRRAVRAICRLFEHLREAEPVTLPDGLPEATAALVLALPCHRAVLLSSFSRMLDAGRLQALLASGRTTRHQLRALRHVVGDTPLRKAIDAALHHETRCGVEPSNG